MEINSAVGFSSVIAVNQIHKPSGERVNYTRTVRGIGPVESSDIVKGCQVDKDVYVSLGPDELEALKVESNKTLDLRQFFDVSEVDPRCFEKPCYIVPAGEHAVEGYLVIGEALRGMNKLGVGQIIMSDRELISRKAAPFEPEGKVVDLLDALRKSLEGGGEPAAGRKSGKPGRSPRKKAS